MMFQQTSRCKKSFLLSVLLVSSVVVVFMYMSSDHMISIGLAGSQPKSAHRLENASAPVFTIEKTTAPESRRKPRVLCWIPSIEQWIQDRIKAINETWVPRCDGHVFFINTAQKGKYGDIIPLDVKEGRKQLTQKTVAALEYLYRHDLNKFDWFLKGDDDTFIIMENLRLLLSQYDASSPVYLGHLFKLFVKQGYMSGGASYLLSREALRKINEEGFQKKACSLKSQDEDLEIGRCLEKIGVFTYNSLDRLGRASFHPESSRSHIGKPGGPGWTKTYDRFPSVGGRNCCSELSISFHHMNPEEIRTMDHLLYRTTVFGRMPDFAKLRRLFEAKRIPPP